MVGQAVSGMASVAGAAYLQAKPGAGIEWIIHNIYHPNTIELRMVDGSGNECSFFEEAAKGLLTNMYIHLTDAHYLRIYNNSGGAIYLSYDGIIALEP